MEPTLEQYRHEMHLNLNVRGLGLSPTLEINEISKGLIKEGRTVFKLGLGQSPFPVPEPVVQALRENAAQKDYLSVRGLEPLRQAVCRYFQQRQGLDFQWQNTLVGPGSKELMFLLQLVYYGDLVIPVPSWVSYAPQANIVGRPVRWVYTRPENSWLITPDDLERLCSKDPTKPRILILNYPNNPTGMSYPEEMLKELAAVARKFHLIILSDEIYGELNFAGTHSSIARYYPEGTIISSGLSKWCGAGGWRLGICVFPGQLNWLLEGMASVASETFTSTSAPIQYAAITAFAGGDWLDDYLQKSRRILNALCQYMTVRLRKSRVKVGDAEGGFYIFPDFSEAKEKAARLGIHDSAEFCQQILKDTGVAMLPGSAFGMGPFDLMSRIAFVDFDGEAALNGLSELSEDVAISDGFLEHYCPRVTEATNRLCRWFDDDMLTMAS
jgi:aspartate aminotransferase